MKISVCDVNEIENDIYSAELKSLVKTILSKDPNLRPSAREILNNPLFSTRTW